VLRARAHARITTTKRPVCGHWCAELAVTDDPRLLPAHSRTRLGARRHGRPVLLLMLLGDGITLVVGAVFCALATFTLVSKAAAIAMAVRTFMALLHVAKSITLRQRAPVELRFEGVIWSHLEHDPKSGNRFSRKNMLKQQANAKRFQLIPFSLLPHVKLRRDVELGKRLPSFIWTKDRESALAASREAAMTWTNHDDVRWELGEIELTAGRIFYWLTTLVAALMPIFAVADSSSAGRKVRRSSGFSLWSPRRWCG